jgi:PTS system nitrogen regulatory IIA component
MTDFSDLLDPDAVLARVPGPTKKHLLQTLATTAGDVYGLAPAVIIETLTEREKLGSTGFGGGIAIPHGRVDGLDRVIGVVAQLAQSVDYQAIDDLPVDLVFMLLSPPQAGADHLKALARVSRSLRDRGFVAKLRGAGSPDALYALLTDAEARDAA